MKLAGTVVLAVGVPATAPVVASSASPAGNAPSARLQRAAAGSNAASPVTLRYGRKDSLYALFTVAFGSAAPARETVMYSTGALAAVGTGTTR